MKRNVHINGSCTIETRHSQLSNDVLNVKIDSQTAEITMIENPCEIAWNIILWFFFPRLIMVICVLSPYFLSEIE